MDFEQRKFAMDIRLFWLALGSFAIGAEGFVISSLLPAVSADTGVTIAQGGYLVLAFALAFALGGPVLASIFGHRDRRNILVVSALVFAFGNLIAGLAHSYEQLLIARVVMALAAGLYAATAQATAVAISEPHHRARAIAVIVGGTTVAVALGAPVGALIAAVFGWRGTFLTITGVAIVAALAIWFLLPAGLKGPRLSLSKRLAVLSRPGLVPMFLTMLLYMTGGFSLFTYVAPFVTQTLGLSAAVMPTVLLSFGVGAAVGNFAGGQLADRVGATRTATGATVLMVLVMAAATGLARLPAGGAEVALLVYMFVWGVVAWSFPPAQASRVIAKAADAAPLALALNGSSLYLGVALSSVVGGEVLTYASPAALGIVGAVFPLMALGIITLSRPAPSLAEARLG
jgi:DHA1 family inner membrane transport protein